MAFFGLFSGKNTADATIRVGYDGRQAESGFKSLGSTVKKLAVAFGGLAVVSKVNSLLRESAELAKVQIQAEAQLASALGRTSQSLLNYASELQKQTTYGDEATIQAAALVAAFIKEEDQIKKLLPAIQDLAAAKGMDLSAAADLVTKSVASSTNALARYGIEITGAAGSSERIDNTVRALTESFGGMAQAIAETDVGKLEQMENTLGDIKEDLGKEILPYMVKWNAFLLDIVKTSSEFFGLTKKTMSIEEIDVKIAEKRKNISFLRGEQEKALFKISKNGIGDQITQRQVEIAQLQAEKAQIVAIETAEKRLQTTRKKKKPVGATKPITTTKRDSANPDDLTSFYMEEEEVSQEYYDRVLEHQKQMQIMALGEEEVYHKERIALIELNYDEGIIPTVQEKNLLLEEENERHNQVLLGQDDELTQKRIANAESFIGNLSSLNSSLIQIYDATTDSKIKNLDREAMGEKAYQKEVERIQEEAEEERKVFARIQQGIAIAEATVNAYKMAVGAGADTTGGAITRGLAVAAAFATGIAQVAAIEAQTFQGGTGFSAGGFARVGEEGPETLFLPRGSGVATATETSMMGGHSGSEITNNFYGLSTEQVIEVERNQNRRKTTGTLI